MDVTLDPDTVRCYLNVNGTRQNPPHNPERLNCGGVLAKEGFSSGRFYFEVQVVGHTDWDLGVAKKSIIRTANTPLNPINGFWTVWVKNENKYDLGSFTTLDRVKPQYVSVFVDYEEGLLSVYNLNTNSHIYSFTGQSFTETLYPYFRPHQNYLNSISDPLIILSVANI